MSIFDVRRFFTLSSDGRHVLRCRFRSRSRLGVALQLGFVRMTGTTLDAIEYVPRAVLEHVGHYAGVDDPMSPVPEYFGHGLPEQVLNELSRVPGLRVIGRTSSFRLRDWCQR
jgi:hypothetical protein